MFNFLKKMVTIKNVNAQCDNCLYQEKIDISGITETEIDGLLHKKCPHCGTEMINENDIKIFKKYFKNFRFDPTANKGFSFRWQTKKHI